MVNPGSESLAEITARLDGAHVALVLLSASFLDREVEVLSLLRRRQQEGLRVIPVLARRVPLTFGTGAGSTWIEHCQPLPRDGQPIAMARDMDEVLAGIALEVGGIVRRPASKPAPVAQPAASGGAISRDTIMAIYTAGIKLGLANNRTYLFSGMPAGSMEMLATVNAPGAQMLSDLHTLAEMPELLAQWLRNAYAVNKTRTEARVFTDAMAVLEGGQGTSESGAGGATIRSLARTEVQFNAFCFDAFPAVARRFRSNMSRDAMLDALLAAVDAEEVVRQICLWKLGQILPAEFERVIAKLSIPAYLLSGTMAPQTTRATEVLRFMEQKKRVLDLATTLGSL